MLRSNITLELGPGATLKATGNRDLFHRYGSLLFAKDAVNVSVRGTDQIDGNFHAYLTQLAREAIKLLSLFLGPYDPLDLLTIRNPPDGRPRMLLFLNCRNIRLEQFTIVDAPTWTIHPIACDGLYIEGISILNDLRVPNCDGIDIDYCRRVRIANCNIQAGDDCLILKTSCNFTEFGPLRGYRRDRLHALEALKVLRAAIRTSRILRIGRETYKSDRIWKLSTISSPSATKRKSRSPVKPVAR